VNAPAIPDFTNHAWQLSRSNVQLTISILEGKNQMQPNRAVVGEEMGPELAAYVRTFAPAPQPAPIEATPATPAVTTPAATPATTTTPEYTAMGDFAADFDSLSKQFDDIQRQSRELAASAVVERTVPPVSVSPVTAPQATAPAVGVTPRAAPLVTPSLGDRTAPTPEKSRAAHVPISERPLTLDDVARGEELFLGRRALANGGPACVACHAVNAGEAREGGRLGPDLTRAYERLGKREGLAIRLWAPATRTSHPAYLGHGLESDEVLSMVAYLEDAGRQAVADAPPPPVKVLLLGAGGAVLGLAFGALWRNRSARRGAAAVGEIVSPPPPADDVGLGL
jgi:mono/diheme cytochrome c family protein